MEALLSKVKIRINDSIFLKDPDSSKLGRNILSGSIGLINEIGFENFTFRKLGEKINTTETSIYRYFESKQHLLIYLTSWYWGLLEYNLVFSLANIESAEKRLDIAINILTRKVEGNFSHPYMDITGIDKIVISESAKTYLTKEVDKQNKIGIFEGYTQLVERVSNIVLEVSPQYKYPHMLISTVVEGAHHQRFFAEHLPGLTDEGTEEDWTSGFYKELVKKAIK